MSSIADHVGVPGSIPLGTPITAFFLGCFASLSLSAGRLVYLYGEPFVPKIKISSVNVNR